MTCKFALVRAVSHLASHRPRLAHRWVIDRRHAIGEKWDMLYEGKPDLFLAHARGFVGEHQYKEFSPHLRELLFDAFKDALEFTAVNRGVERW